MAAEAGTLVEGVAVVYLYVRDMERSRAFYRDVLGIPLEGDDMWCEARFPSGVRFALHAAHEGIGELGSGTVHVSLTVADADAAAERLRAAGVAVAETMRDEWGTALEVVDPEGYRVYLFQPPA